MYNGICNQPFKVWESNTITVLNIHEKTTFLTYSLLTTIHVDMIPQSEDQGQSSGQETEL